jgi:hypothetical protein
MSGAAASWDAEYASGRYQHEPPESFVGDILTAARQDRRGGYTSVAVTVATSYPWWTEALI